MVIVFPFGVVLFVMVADAISSAVNARKSFALPPSVLLLPLMSQVICDQSNKCFTEPVSDTPNCATVKPVPVNVITPLNTGTSSSDIVPE